MLGRLIEQYKDSTKLVALLSGIADLAQELYDSQQELLNAFDLETATHWRLDTIGVIVGLPRPLIDAGLFTYFGYLGAPGVLGYGTTADPSLGGVYASVFTETSGIVPMEDDMYRLNIQAKILRNSGSALHEEILEIIRTVFPGAGSPTTIAQNGVAGYLLTIGRPLSDIEQNLLDLTDLNGQGDQLVPRAIGVQETYA